MSNTTDLEDNHSSKPYKQHTHKRGRVEWEGCLAVERPLALDYKILPGLH